MGKALFLYRAVCCGFAVPHDCGPDSAYARSD